MPTSKTMRLTVVRAPDDEASFSPGYQRELRQFFNLVRAEGTKISAAAHTSDSIGGGGYTGEFFIALVQVIGPALRGAAVAWMQGRAGRTVRVKVGDTEVVANHSVELHGLFDSVTAVEERLTQPRARQ
jgi:predicted short-subunit dehydrogenase-like oxidoreductase (DUF2520 family)